eukprot:CAMPEP_0196737444 /NCGR_PEP_ID=MMETSP1091-20130531/15179_1 /TAXON_ID=302021 /ORGANISM="Rhodomonas sp., Strain CCMP768" /LENGTH=111 /DNA_ID=CAMNT_0042081299 /DNA_START=19 /DNA_END=350 /DNA_ORIENTATION=+
MIFLIHTFLQFTPAAFAVNLVTSALVGVLKLLVALVRKAVCGAQEESSGGHDGDHGMAPYKQAVESGAFGTFAHNYDVSIIGQYEKTLAVGDSLHIYRQVSPYEALTEVQP